MRQEVTSVFSSSLLEDRGVQNQRSSFSLIVFFFRFADLFGTKNPPREVPPAVKQEVNSFKLLLPPARE